MMGGRGNFVPTPPIYGPFYPTVDPAWIERLKRRQAAISQLSNGLRAFLGTIACAGVDDICAGVEYLLGEQIAEQLAQIENIEKNPPVIQPPTMEDLDRAQREVETIHGQLDALDNLTDSLPEETGDYLDKLQRPMLESQLTHAQDWLSSIQKRMEESTAPAVETKGESA